MAELCIVSNNCYGGPYYHKNNYQYNTPFIGLFLFAPCYIELLEHFDEYMSETLEQTKESKYGNFSYPIGKLKSVEIHFMHEISFSDAKEKWDRRKERIDLTKCIVKMCDRDGADESILRRFLALNYKKILFISKKYSFSDPCVIKIPERYDECPDGYELESLYPIQTAIAITSATPS